jgi:betaine-aldehyde dehydrogenase
MRLAELAIEAGLPAGLFNVVSGDDELGKALVNHQGIAMVSVTGATSTGRNIMRSAADTTKRVHLELGGKAPVLVFEDADLAAMAQSIALGATYNTGQDCTAATRVYVQKSKFDEACAQLSQVMKTIKFGMPEDPASDIGPLISAEQREQVHGFVQRAVAGGATVLTGGEIPDLPGYFYPPTLIANVKQNDDIVQNEVFGPVLVVLPFEDEAHAIELANDSQFGLGSYLFTTDDDQALRVADALDTGMVYVNGVGLDAPELPFGGTKRSGFGRELGPLGIEEFLNKKLIRING